MFSINGDAVRPTAGDVFGIVSLVFWSVALAVSIKYAFVRRVLGGARTLRVAVVMTLGVQSRS